MRHLWARARGWKTHAVINCPHARMVLKNMRKAWPLPDEKQLQTPGPDWLLLILHKLSKEEVAIFLMILWRNWTDRNELTHGGRFSEFGSLLRLEAMCNSTMLVSSLKRGDAKMKNILGLPIKDQARMKYSPISQTPVRWQPPDRGWIKINVNASYIEETGQASAGYLVRNDQGVVIVSGWRLLFHCSSADEAELLACKEGLAIAQQWSHEPAVPETDSANCVAGIAWKKLERSIMAAILQDRYKRPEGGIREVG
uniref:RNase H type-1 domain-containing protein n=1 Tax=Setaria italica TaxID=4555 RepID=K3YMM7_SETIT